MIALRRLILLAALAALAASASAVAGPRAHHRRPRHPAPRRRAHHPTTRHRATHHPATGHPAGSGGCPGAQTPATASDLAAMRAAVLCLVNGQRTSRGLPALASDARLDRAAQGWSQTMVSTGAFSHGADFAARITASGFDWSAAGENIATGFATPAAVVSGWMGSEGHCRNILDPGYSVLGIGMVARPVAGAASGPATWTEDFALPMGRSAPSGNTGPQSGCPY